MNTQSFKTSEAGNSWIVVDAKNKLGTKMIKKLKIYNNNEHPHKAQNPSEVEL